jgi:hypothetical protein
VVDRSAKGNGLDTARPETRLRQMKSVMRINGLPLGEFWKNYDAGEYK